MVQIDEYNGYVIYEDDGASPDFYCRLGRFFASKEVIKELEGPFYDDPAHVWVIAMQGDQVAAFGAVRLDELSRGIAHLTVVYVLPAHRRKGLYRKLFEWRERICINHHAQYIRGIANPTSQPVFEEHGYTLTRMAGKWAYFQKEVADAVVAHA